MRHPDSDADRYGDGYRHGNAPDVADSNVDEHTDGDADAPSPDSYTDVYGNADQYTDGIADGNRNTGNDIGAVRFGHL
jgi:hypothetical protein